MAKERKYPSFSDQPSVIPEGERSGKYLISAFIVPCHGVCGSATGGWLIKILRQRPTGVLELPFYVIIIIIGVSILVFLIHFYWDHFFLTNLPF